MNAQHQAQDARNRHEGSTRATARLKASCLKLNEGSDTYRCSVSCLRSLLATMFSPLVIGAARLRNGTFPPNRLHGVTAALLLTVILCAAAPMSAGPLIASADEVSESDSTSQAVLVPGENWVGWLGHTAELEDLKEQVPKLESVRAWDPVRQELVEPAKLTPGMGLQIRVAGSSRVRWTLPARPVTGRVDLRRGRNLVAWFGLDRTLIDEAVRGIGASLITASRAGGGRVVNRGDALWVTVKRDVIWLQPTGILPVVKFPGGVTDEVRARVIDSLEYTLGYFRETFAIEADFAGFIVYAPRNGDSLIESLRQDFPSLTLRESWIRNSVEEGTAWVENGAPYTVLPQLMWTEVRDPAYGDEYPVWRGQFVTAHEYVHVLQSQLRGVGIQEKESGLLEDFKFQPPTWMVEGNAMWVMDAVHVRDGVDNWDAVRAEALADVFSYGSLRDQGENKFYPLGRAATRFLVDRSGSESWVEFWRQLAPIQFGPQAEFEQRAHWADAFEVAFGMTLAEFYAVFEDHRAGWGHRVSGEIVLSDSLASSVANNSAFQGIDVAVTGQVDTRDDQTRHLSFTHRTDKSGAFSFNVGNGQYTLQVKTGRCKSEGVRVRVDNLDVTGIKLTIPECRLVAGDFFDADGIGIARAVVFASTDKAHASAYTDHNGAFSIELPGPGSYRISTQIDGCRVYHRQGGLTGSYQRATPVRITDSDVTGVRMQLASGMCELRISGRLLNEDGTPATGKWVNASGDAGFSNARADADGSFSFTVFGRGSYKLSTWAGDCSVYLGSQGPTKDWHRARSIRVAAADVAGVEFRLTADLASFCN